MVWYGMIYKVWYCTYVCHCGMVWYSKVCDGMYVRMYLVSKYGLHLPTRPPTHASQHF